MASAWQHSIAFMTSQGVMVLWVLLFAAFGWLCSRPLETGGRDERRTVVSVLSFGLPVFLLWILYHPVLENWWLIDDPCHLYYVAQHGPWPAFYDPARGFSPINFTPWEPLSLGIDYLLFGLNPVPFYLHHMISLTLLVLCAAIVLRRFLSPFYVTWTLALFVASVPLCDAANHLMTRHYIEGLIFALLSVWLFAGAREKTHTGMIWGSSFFYLLACLAKEVYVPLVGIYAVLSTGTLKRRLYTLFPFLSVALVYTLWRFHMLDSAGMLSAYPHIPVTIGDVAYLPLAVAKAMGWDRMGPLAVVGLLSMLFVYFLTKNTPKGNLLVLMLALCVIVPIIPVSSTPYSRYLIVFSFVFFIALGVGLKYFQESFLLRGYGNGLVLLLAVAAVLVGMVHVQKQMGGWRDYGRAISAEGKFLLYHDDPQALLVTVHGHCYWAFSALRKTVLGLPQGPSFCVSDCACTYLYPGKKVWINVDGRLTRGKAVMEVRNPEECGEKRELSIRLRYSRNSLEWAFGPYREGRYFLFLRGWDSGFIQVKREGRMAWESDLVNDFILVKYESYDGWKTYSPVIGLDRATTQQGSLEWRR